MDYKRIDRETWGRKEFFEHYLNEVPCTYSMTVSMDITELRRRKLRLYPAMLYCLTKVVNRYEPFRTAFRADGTLVVYRTMHPCYTVFHKDTKTFSNLWTEFSDDYDLFCRRYGEDLRRYGAVKAMTAKPDMPENCFTASMVPWTSFTGFNINVKSFTYLLPIFTMGKFRESHGRCRLPLAVQVHHAVCDGYYVSCFLNDLQELIGSADFKASDTGTEAGASVWT